MLSRLSLCGGQSLRQGILKFQPAFLTTSAGPPSDKVVQKDTVSPPPGHFPEYPPPTSKRDFVNFPKTMFLRETPPPVRFGFIPDSWFQFMYPKTGYTGPYVLMFTVLTYCFSKEIILFDHNLMHMCGLAFAFYAVTYKFGNLIKETYTKALQEEIDLVDSMQDQPIKEIKENIKELKSLDKMKAAVGEVVKARTEFIQLQLENAFRERVVDVFTEVKNKLDCQAELENVEKRMILKNMMDYIIRNVTSSLTPDLEKKVLQTCITDLNALAARS